MNNTDYQLQKTDAIAKITNGNPFLNFPAFNNQLWYETKMNILMNYEEESRLQCIMNNSHKMRKATLKF